jgi:cell division protein FtsZ
MEITREDLLKFDSPGTYRDTALAIGIRREGAASLEYMKEKGIQGVDFVIPDENLTARDLESYRLVFLVGGMDNQHNIRMVRSIANIAKELEVLTIGIMTLPSPNEKAPNAVPYPEETESLKEVVDLLIIISNEALPGPDNRPFFGNIIDYVHYQIWLAAKTIVEVMAFNGVIRVDLEDVRSVTKNGGYGFISFGQASGADRVLNAVRMTIPVPSKISDQIGSSKNILIYIYYGPNEITIAEIEEIMEFLQNSVNPQCNIIWNCGYDPNLQDDLRISVIWTGMEKPPVIPVSDIKSTFF